MGSNKTAHQALLAERRLAYASLERLDFNQRCDLRRKVSKTRRDAEDAAEQRRQQNLE